MTPEELLELIELKELCKELFKADNIEEFINIQKSIKNIVGG